MQIVVTGHRGYLGQVLTKLLIMQGHRVLGLDNNIYELDKAVNRRQDIRTARISEEADMVIHLAAVVGEPACEAFYQIAKSTNLTGTQMVIEECQKRSVPLIFASTCSVYGAQDAVLFEDSETKPIGPYARYRLAAERDVVKAGGTVLRFGTLFGWSPRMRFDLVINHWAREVHQGKPIRVDGGKQWRPFTHVSDAAGAILCVLDAVCATVGCSETSMQGEIFNVAGINSTIIELANTFRKVTGCDVRINDQVADVRDYRVNSEKLEQLGWHAETDIEGGIIEMLDKLKGTKQDLYAAKFSNFEALKERFHRE